MSVTGPLLEARHITFGYVAGSPILDDWNESFWAGEIVALTGRSGQGKSTLLHILGLLLKPNAGAILLSGQECSSATDSTRAALRASTLGFVFQDAALDATRSVLDNVVEPALYSGMERTEAVPRALRLLQHFGVVLRANHRPGQVSGGQAQRIALCRSLLVHPKILLADEPTGNLDRDSTAVVVDGMRDHARQGAVVIVATHDPLLVAQCDREVPL